MAREWMTGAYTEGQGVRVTRADFEANLLAKLGDRDFRTDILPLHAPGLDYDVDAAAAWVGAEVLSRLPKAGSGFEPHNAG